MLRTCVCDWIHNATCFEFFVQVVFAYQGGPCLGEGNCEGQHELFPSVSTDFEQHFGLARCRLADWDVSHADLTLHIYRCWF